MKRAAFYLLAGVIAFQLVIVAGVLVACFRTGNERCTGDKVSAVDADDRRSVVHALWSREDALDNLSVGDDVTHAAHLPLLLLGFLLGHLHQVKDALPVAVQPSKAKHQCITRLHFSYQWQRSS